ncbi:hypothetical protein JTB14_027174 [Gonioctena quinquepunctata]|nr:hypothetical protein JTB14_027174 [Gonioctena quinquepunctata]
MTITEFRDEVITAMLGRNRAEDQAEAAPSKRRNVPPEPKHYLIENEKERKKVLERCSECYKKYGREGKEVSDKVVKASQVITKCSVCGIFISHK